MSTFRTSPVRLNEGVYSDASQDVQVLKTCTFYHDRYGKVEITHQMLSEMVENFKKGTRGIDVMIDYAHNSDLEAAAWIKNLKIIENQDLGQHELWATAEWTPKGHKTLADKEYAYLSADFDPDYRDNENPEVRHGAVLLGAGLTNRPVVKRMESIIELSEYSKKESAMQEKELADKEKMEMMEKQLEEYAEKMKLQEDEMGMMKKVMEELGVDSVEGLLEKIAEMKSKMEEGKEIEIELAELKEEKSKREKEFKFNELMKKGLVTEAQREKALKLSEKEFNSFVDVVGVNEKGLKFSEVGHGKEEAAPKKEAAKDVADIVRERAVKLSEEKKLPMGKAISQVLKEDKELSAKYYGNK